MRIMRQTFWETFHPQVALKLLQDSPLKCCNVVRGGRNDASTVPKAYHRHTEWINNRMMPYIMRSAESLIGGKSQVLANKSDDKQIKCSLGALY